MSYSEPTNTERAAWGEGAVNAFAEVTYCGRTFTATVKEQPGDGDDAYTMIQDLITDLLHLAARHGWEADDMMRRARDAFDYEQEEESA